MAFLLFEKLHQYCKGAGHLAAATAGLVLNGLLEQQSARKGHDQH